MRAVVLLKSVVLRGGARRVSALLAAVLLATPLWADAEGAETSIAPDAASAVWTLQQLRFKLDDSPAQYTCKEFRDRVNVLLLALGARKDLQVEPTACTNTRVDFGNTPGILGVPMGVKDGPSDAPQVSIRMQILKVLGEPQPNVDGLPAHWKSIDLVGKHGPLYASDCALTKQVAEVILPLFSTRNVEYNSTRCDRIIGGPVVHLHLEVLVTDHG
jgi:hypothetical protein